jgi:hypothetical protein
LYNSVYEYYGSKYELSEVNPIKCLPIPSAIAKQFAEQKDKKVVTWVFAVLVTRNEFLSYLYFIEKK